MLERTPRCRMDQNKLFTNWVPSGRRLWGKAHSQGSSTSARSEQRTDAHGPSETIHATNMRSNESKSHLIMRTRQNPVNCCEKEATSEKGHRVHLQSLSLFVTAKTCRNHEKHVASSSNSVWCHGWMGQQHPQKNLPPPRNALL